MANVITWIIMVVGLVIVAAVAIIVLGAILSALAFLGAAILGVLSTF